MKNCAQYIAEAKGRLTYRSDRELGERFGCSAQAIAAAKRGKMTDPLAVKVAEVLGIEAGEVLWVARTERERDPTVRMHLEAWGDKVGKMLARVPAKAVSALGALAVALSLFQPAPNAQLAYGGEGR